MRRRLILALLVPALVGTMVGVGFAAKAKSGEAPAVVEAPVVQAVVVEPVDEPTEDGVEEPTEEPVEEPAEEPTEDPTEDAGPGYDVAAVQQQLTEGRYYIGAIDGKPGPATTSAIMAFQKVNGLSADGVVGPATLAALAAPAVPALKGGPATRIEVDLTKQVLYLVKGDALVRTLPVSSGNGATYATAGGGTARALTPVGTFTIERRIVGERHAPLGVLYDPLYFHKGWAIHGSNSVPAYPASHGCVRVTRPDAIWLAGQVSNGTTVILYGGTHTFERGSAAAGTDAPAGDTTAPEPTSPEPAPTAAPTPEPQPTAAPTPAPEPTAAPTPAPEPATSTTPEPEPAADPTPAPDDSGTPLPAP
jgi:lipoprotein-anchoring transpeptidase ErfK/SrfK